MPNGVSSQRKRRSSRPVPTSRRSDSCEVQTSPEEKIVAERIRELLRRMTKQPPYDGRTGGITHVASLIGISQPALTQILDGGGISLKTLIGIGRLPNVDIAQLLATPGRPGMSKLEICIAYHESRWSSWTLAAARSGMWGDDPPGAVWEGRLDRIEDALGPLKN
jgi:hypothetical protein